MKNLCIYDVSINGNLYQNRLINECARKKKAKTRNPGVFLERYRRTYVLNEYVWLLKPELQNFLDPGLVKLRFNIIEHYLTLF